MADLSTAFYNANRLRRERDQALDAHHHDMAILAGGDQAEAHNTGHRPRTVVPHKTSDKEKAEKRRRHDLQHQLLLQQLLDDIARIDREIAENNEAIALLQAKNTEIEKLQQLIASGSLDTTDPHHAALMSEYGIGVEDIERGLAVDKLQRQFDQNTADIETLNRRNVQLSAQREIAANQIQSLDENGAFASLDKSSAAYQELKAARSRNIARDIEQTGTLQSNTAVEDRREAIQDKALLAARGDLEQQTAEFQRAISQAEKITDPIERLHEQQRIIEGLSDDVALEASMNSVTAHLFDNDYFSAIQHQPNRSEYDSTESRAPIMGLGRGV